MNFQYSPQARVERLLALGRVVLASFSLFAIWLDPTEPAKHVQVTYAALAGYVIYALLLTLLAQRSVTFLVRFRLLTHSLDFVAFCFFIYLTEAPHSPFFVYFVFSLLCATLRWQWRGTLWTAVATLGAFLGMGGYVAEILGDPTFELDRFIIRSVYLVVIAMLLGYFGAHQQQLNTELSKLAAWPSPPSRDAPALVHDLLTHAADLLDTTRVLMVWEEPEEPWCDVASWFSGRFDYSREPPDTFAPLVAEPLATASFFCQDVQVTAPTVVYLSSDDLQRWSGAPLHPQMQARFAIESVLSLCVNGESLKGRLFFLDKPRMTSDDLVLGTIVAREIETRMDQFFLVRQLQQVATAEERLRLARDLHDGLLQSLTGANLQLETAHRLLEENPEVARERLLDIQHLLIAEQRDLRSFIRELKPTSLGPAATAVSLTARLEELSARIERHWGLHVTMHLDYPEVEIPAALRLDIYRIVHEALINVARHARATAAQVALGMQDSQVHITVTDNGRGFSFRGDYDLAALAALDLGPLTLRERIASLGGSLRITSTDTGAHLSLTLLLGRPGV